MEFGHFNGGDENDDDDDEQNRYRHLDVSTLDLSYVDLDDLFTGAARYVTKWNESVTCLVHYDYHWFTIIITAFFLTSKRRWFRPVSRENLRLLMEDELFIYINYHVVPYLRTVLSRNQSENFFYFFYFLHGFSLYCLFD